MKTTIDKKTEQIIFLYKLLEGETSKSFGIEVASLSGLPSEITVEAYLKGEEFHRTAGLQEITEIN